MYTVKSVQTHIIQIHFVMTALEFVREEALMKASDDTIAFKLAIRL